MYLTIIVAGLFLVGATINLIEGNYSDGIVGILISSFVAGVYFYFRKESQKSVEFINWVLSNEEAIKQGKAIYEGKRIDLETEVTRFQACFSFLIVTTKSSSRYFVKGQDFTFMIGLFYSLITLIFGWWGIPWGPVYTIQVLFRNIRGGYKQSVSEVIVEIGGQYSTNNQESVKM